MIRLVLSFLLAIALNHATSSSKAEGFPSLDTSDDALATAAMDWGGTVQRTPLGVFRPTTAIEIADLLVAADREGVKVAARGRGHSVMGQAQVEEGVVIDMSGLADIGDVEDTEEGGKAIWVGACASWRTVIESTLPEGFMPPVLTDYVDLSVGGTLSVGGVGAQTGFHGLQTDNVLAFEIATASGDVLVCSPSSSSEECPFGLFDATRGGLGQFGIITKARLRLLPAPTLVRYVRALYSSFAELLEDMDTLLDEERVSGVQGFAVPSDPDGLAQATGNAFPDAVLPVDIGPFAYLLETYHDVAAVVTGILLLSFAR